MVTGLSFQSYHPPRSPSTVEVLVPKLIRHIHCSLFGKRAYCRLRPVLKNLHRFDEVGHRYLDDMLPKC